MADVLDRTLELAERAVKAGVDEARITIDAAHDFGKNTSHSLEWLGARIFRANDVTQTRQALNTVSAIRGDLPRARTLRGLA
jgi:dihydropteroate synthase